MKKETTKYFLLGIVTFFVVTLDQITKAVIERTLSLHDTITVIPGILSIWYVRNPGAAFGVMSNLPDSVRFFFLVGVSSIAMILIVYLFIQGERGRTRYLLSLAFIFSGAIGNLIDRVLMGEVRDFIDLYIGIHHWPTFNLADSAITIGLVFLAYEILVVEPRLERAARQKREKI